MLLFSDPICAGYEMTGHLENPARITRSIARIQEAHPEWEWQKPTAATESSVLLAHTAELVHRVQAGETFDADTPSYPQIHAHALRSTGAAIDAMSSCLQHGPAFSLMRPPGHHATSDRAMGFCYYNGIAIAALEALARGISPVAVWDFDVHHGNGSEEILQGKEGVFFASVHQYPCYPGTGKNSFANIHNYPVPPATPAAAHMKILRQSFEQLLQYNPMLLLVSAGFDAFIHDPLSDMRLQIDDYLTLGKWVGASKIHAAAVLEGGYSEALPDLILAFLQGWDQDCPSSGSGNADVSG